MLAAGKVVRALLIAEPKKFTPVCPDSIKKQVAANGVSDQYKVSSDGKSEPAWRAPNPLFAARGRYDNGHISAEMRQQFCAEFDKCSKEIIAELGEDVGKGAVKAMADIFADMFASGVIPPGMKRT